MIYNINITWCVIFIIFNISVHILLPSLSLLTYIMVFNQNHFIQKTWSRGDILTFCLNSLSVTQSFEMQLRTEWHVFFSLKFLSDDIIAGWHNKPHTSTWVSELMFHWLADLHPISFTLQDLRSTNGPLDVVKGPYRFWFVGSKHGTTFLLFKTRFRVF